MHGDNRLIFDARDAAMSGEFGHAGIVNALSDVFPECFMQ
jgi:hypothetical protein